MGKDVVYHIIIDLVVGLLRQGFFYTVMPKCTHWWHRWVLNGAAIAVAAVATVVIVG